MNVIQTNVPLSKEISSINRLKYNLFFFFFLARFKPWEALAWLKEELNP